MLTGRGFSFRTRTGFPTVAQLTLSDNLQRGWEEKLEEEGKQGERKEGRELQNKEQRLQERESPQDPDIPFSIYRQEFSFKTVTRRHL